MQDGTGSSGPEAAPAIAALFAPESVMARDAIADHANVTKLFAEEAEGTDTWAPRRVGEYATARVSAHAALADIGGAGPIVRRSNGEPAWPAGFTGSISHTRGYCIAVAARRAAGADDLVIGIDAERVDRISASIGRRILTDAERSRMHDGAKSAHQRFIAGVFAAKEAFYKAHHQLQPGYLGFDVVTVREHDDGTLTFTDGAERLAVDVDTSTHGRIAVIDGRVIAAVWIRGPVRSTPDARPVPSAP